MNLTFDIAGSGAKKGDLLLALVVRNATVVPPPGWQTLVTLGASGLFLDAFGRLVDDGEPASAVFVGDLEEIQGELVVVRGGAPGTVLEASAHQAFSADATPDSPTIATKQAINLALCVWSATGSLTLTAPAGFTTIDAFTTAIVSARSLLVAYKVIGQTGTGIALPAASSSGAATGRSFALVLRDRIPPRPVPLDSLIAGNLGILKRARK